MYIFTIRQANWYTDGYSLRKIREEVFIHEQKIPVELEWDEFDASSFHALALDSNDLPIGTARYTPTGYIGRIAVLKKWRGRGAGSALLQSIIGEIKDKNKHQALLNAQIAAVDFYKKFGFKKTGKEFLEAGIPHVKMILQL